MKGLIRAWVFICAITLGAMSVAQTYTVTDLGTLKGDNESSALGINNLGDVVGCSDVETSEGYPCTGLVPVQHAFYWSKTGGIKDLGTLAGGNVSAASGINDSGTVVGYSNLKGQPATTFYAFSRTSSGAMVNLGTLPGGNTSSAFQVNSSGMIAGDSVNSSGVIMAASWMDQKIKNLGALPGSVFSAALAINDSGHAVGESVFNDGPPFTSRGFLWNGSKLEDLGTLSGGLTSIANAINTSGVIVGQSDGSRTGGHWHAVMWDTSGNIQDLGLIPGGNYSIAFAVNDSNVVVGYGNLSDNAAHAMIWTSVSGMRDLNSLIPADSGWVLVNANAINDVGQIVGYGVKDGYNHAFLLTPGN